jgi:hypothetical protein
MSSKSPGTLSIAFLRPALGQGRLDVGELVTWWRATVGLEGKPEKEVAHHLYRRLCASVKENPVERLVFHTYCERYASERAASLPALLPQVYLHYDPLTRSQRHGRPSVLMRERMDFLLLLPRRVRVVIEVDGKQHYADGETASPRLYADMLAEDRRPRLRGYEVFHFGGFELGQPGAAGMLRSFFDELLAKYTELGGLRRSETALAELNDSGSQIASCFVSARPIFYLGTQAIGAG